MITMAKNNGFTLVEVVVASVLVSVLALGVFALFSMYNDSAKETSGLLRMQRQCDVLMDEIGRKVRGANVILDVSDNFANYDPHESYDTIHVSGIRLFDKNGIVLGGFRFNGNIIEECIASPCANTEATNWRGFNVDGQAIRIASGSDNYFVVGTDRKQIDVNTTLTLENNESLTLTVERGTFQCRL